MLNGPRVISNVKTHIVTCRVPVQRLGALVEKVESVQDVEVFSIKPDDGRWVKDGGRWRLRR